MKYVALIRKVFGPGPNQRHGYPGHPEIELALLRLYTETRNQDAYDLGRYFLEERGNSTGQDGKHYYDWESDQRGDSPWKRPDCYPRHRSYWYNQAQCPILEQKTIEGHSVRAMYLLTAAADMVNLDRDNKQKLATSEEWVTALTRLWDNMVDQKMYVTGGIGAIEQWEGFGGDYFLPQGTDEGGCYAETCASIGVIMLAERLLQYDLQGRYADVMELCLYNNVMTAMSLNGRVFTYVNQLASSDKDKSERQDWFEVSCCPPNLTRLFGSLGGYLWDFGVDGDEAFVNVHLYTTAKLTFGPANAAITLEQKSNWPWEGTVALQITKPRSVQTMLRLRLPAWCQESFAITPAPSTEQIRISRGYLILAPEFVHNNASFTLEIKNFGVRYITPHPYTNQRTLTLARGPVIYCAEDTDNEWEANHFKDVIIQRSSPVTEEQRVFEEAGEDYIALKTTCWKRSMKVWETKQPGLEPGMLAMDQTLGEEKEIVFVPYYFRANRGGKGHMRVGLLGQ